MSTPHSKIGKRAYDEHGNIGTITHVVINKEKHYVYHGNMDDGSHWKSRFPTLLPSQTPGRVHP